MPQRQQALVPWALLLFWRQSVLIGIFFFFFLRGQAKGSSIETHTNSRFKGLLAKGCQGCKRLTWLQGGDWAGTQKWELMRGSGQTNHTLSWQKSYKLALRPCMSSIPNRWRFSESQKIVPTDFGTFFVLEKFRKWSRIHTELNDLFWHSHYPCRRHLVFSSESVFAECLSFMKK